MQYYPHSIPPTIAVTECKWQKELNQLSMPWDQIFPTMVQVTSPKSGQTRTYVHLTENDPRLDQDGWDGVQMIYKTKTPTNNADYLVLYHTR